MERTPDRRKGKSSAHKIKGPVESGNRSAQEMLEQRFANPQFWPDEEREKTLEESETIQVVTEKLQEFLSGYGGVPLDVNESHIHILDETRLPAETLKRIETTDPHTAGGFMSHAQHIVIPNWKFDSLLDFARLLSHEEIHFLSYNSFRTSSNGLSPTPHQLGIASWKTKEGGEILQHFEWLNEAITEELNILFWEWLGRVGPYTIHVDLAENEDGVTHTRLIGIKKIATPAGDEHEAEVCSFFYRREREEMWKLIADIQARNSGRFTSDEEVFSVFARAVMTGDIQEMAQLIESLGRGRFRKVVQNNPARE